MAFATDRNGNPIYFTDVLRKMASLERQIDANPANKQELQRQLEAIEAALQLLADEGIIPPLATD